MFFSVGVKGGRSLRSNYMTSERLYSSAPIDGKA